MKWPKTIWQAVNINQSINESRENRSNQENKGKKEAIKKKRKLWIIVKWCKIKKNILEIISEIFEMTARENKNKSK